MSAAAVDVTLLLTQDRNVPAFVAACGRWGAWLRDTRGPEYENIVNMLLCVYRMDQDGFSGGDL